MKRKNKIDKLKIRNQCIRKFFFAHLQEFSQISRSMKKQNGGDFQSLGIEKSLETMVKLFDEGRFNILFDDIDNFIIWMEKGDEITILHEEGEPHGK